MNSNSSTRMANGEWGVASAVADLGVVELWQPRRGEAARHLRADRLRLDLVAEQAVVDVAGDLPVGAYIRGCPLLRKVLSDKRPRRSIVTRAHGGAAQKEFW